MSFRVLPSAMSVSSLPELRDTLRTRLARHRVRRAAYANTYRELACLTDRELNDLGFARADIRDICERAGDAAVQDFERTR